MDLELETNYSHLKRYLTNPESDEKLCNLQYCHHPNMSKLVAHRHRPEMYPILLSISTIYCVSKRVGSIVKDLAIAVVFKPWSITTSYFGSSF